MDSLEIFLLIFLDLFFPANKKGIAYYFWVATGNIKGSSTAQPVQHLAVRREQVREEVVQAEQARPSLDQDPFEDIDQVLRDLKGKVVAHEEEIPSHTPFEPAMHDDFHHVSPPPIETQPRSQGETSRTIDDELNVVLKQQDMLGQEEQQPEQVAQEPDNFLEPPVEQQQQQLPKDSDQQPQQPEQPYEQLVEPEVQPIEQSSQAAKAQPSVQKTFKRRVRRKLLKSRSILFPSSQPSASFDPNPPSAPSPLSPPKTSYALFPMVHINLSTSVGYMSHCDDALYTDGDWYNRTGMKRTMAGRGRRSAQSRRYEQNRKLKNFVKGLKPSVRAKLLELDSRTLEEILGVATKQESRVGPLQEGEAISKEDVIKPFQGQDKKKEKLVESPKSTVTSINEKPECIQCGKRHGGSACWRKEGRCLKCGSKEHRLKECPNLKIKFTPRGASSTAIKEQGVAGDDLGDVTTGTRCDLRGRRSFSRGGEC
ncbi:hypothetical protein Taro_042919 [Colocasia esculenta]|uniref:CCHC-type domain-containing protein n=1 Tax=Colocasia esculenta TaxID=4460 RepID=A0A843WI44_COLES|nr:hypothetical protein [Colocasia esculenta]